MEFLWSDFRKYFRDKNISAKTTFLQFRQIPRFAQMGMSVSVATLLQKHE
jgi:hypothetical protein